MMEQIFYAPDITVTSELPEDEFQHCIQVLRLQTGDPIIITDGKGFFYDAVIENIRPKHCRVNIVNTRTPHTARQYAVHVAIAPTKNMDRMEWFVEKATEIGIDTITFLRCRHSERKEIKLQRLYKTAISAIKQSRKAMLPQINDMVDFHSFIAFKQERCVKMIAHCAEDRKQLLQDVYTPPQDSLVLIGPEGDFSREEIEAALTAGFQPVSLGESRLRTETAGLIACHTVHLLNM